MVNRRLLPGKNLTQHPLDDGGEHGVFTRGGPFMAIRADQGGSIDTPNGVKTFHAGDWICTDIPPTYAWVIDAQTFAVAGYTKVGELDGQSKVVFPVAEADNEVKHSDYTGVATPPANASEALQATPELAEGGSTDAQATAEIENATTVVVESPADLASQGKAEILSGDMGLQPSEAELNAAEPVAAPSPTNPTPSRVPRAQGPQTKATLPKSVPTSPPRAKTGRK
jgi:hypothetical protein